MSEKKTRKIKVIHDGGLNVVTGSKVVDVETGEAIQWVSRVEIILDVQGGARAVLHVYAPALDIEIDADVVEHPRAEKYPEPGVSIPDIGERAS